MDYADVVKREKKIHKELMKSSDCRANMRYLRAKLDTIQITGSNKVKGGDRKKLKHLEATLLSEPLKADTEKR